MMKRITCFIAAASCLMLFACNHAGNTSQKEGHQSFADFLQQFPPLRLPFSLNEDSLAKSYSDSLQLSKALLQYIPDSLRYPGGKHRPETRVYPVGKNQFGKLYLLFIKTWTQSGRHVVLLIYDDADTLVNAREVASSDRKNRGQLFTFSLDDKYLLQLNERKELSNGHVITREQVYGINPDGSLVLILTNTNQPASAGSFYNPIDTLPQKHRYSGDYLSGKSDLVSIRDADKEGSFLFFIHLNKNNGDCTGEIDGTGKFTGKTTGEFREDGGSCAIRFTFSGSRVTIKETGGCGAYRGISCYFDGTYLRKKQVHDE